MRRGWILVLSLLLALWLLSLLIRLDPVRTGAAALLIYGGYRLSRSRPEGAETGLPTGRWTPVGSVQRMNQQYPLEGFALNCGLADVKMDLSRAIVPAGEHVIAIRGLLGDVSLYLPDDLPVEVVASVGVGALDVLGRSQAGLGRRAAYTDGGFGKAVARVRIIVALAAGDVDVRWI